VLGSRASPSLCKLATLAFIHSDGTCSDSFTKLKSLRRSSARTLPPALNISFRVRSGPHALPRGARATAATTSGSVKLASVGGAQVQVES